MRPSQKARGLLAKEINQCRNIRSRHPELDIPRLFLRTRKIKDRPPTFSEAETTYLYSGGFTIIAAFCDDSYSRANGIDLGYLVFNGETTHPCCITKSEPADGDLIGNCGSLLDALVVCKTQVYQREVESALRLLRHRSVHKSPSKVQNFKSDEGYPKRRKALTKSKADVS